MKERKNGKSFGICLGASTISAVEMVQNDGELKIVNTIFRSHGGNPKATFSKVIDELNTGDSPVLITGRKFRNFVKFPSITEPEASEYALEYITEGKEKYDALVSAGGETFMVYRLDHKQKIVGISTGNKCASGTGEFFLQQIKRMDLGVEEAVEIASTGTPYAVSGRCSVFCKSDCTHALNKGEPISDVTAGLCQMIAQKVVELLAKIPHDKVMIVGGTALNRVVVNFIREDLKTVDVPAEAAYFEALGAAIAAFERGIPRPAELFDEEHSNFNFLSPLKDFEHLVTYNQTQYDKAREGDKCIVGLDVGSTTTKAVLMRVTDNKFLASIYLRTNGNPVEASRKCYQSILDQLGGTKVKIVGIGVTGSGRQIAGLYSLTEGIINEIIAHAAAAVYFDPDVDTIFEIGGQDAKYTYITNSVASDYAMNEACSAGTGSFLEEAAYESLGVKVEDIAELAVLGKRPPNFNDQCAAFISSDIKNATHEGISQEDILAGLVYSICLNYINRVKGHRPVGEKVFVQGGVCYNRAVPLAMAGILHKPIIVPPEPGLMGSFGVALELKKRMDLGLISESSFDLHTIVNRQVAYKEPFICNGGKEKCDIKCSINRILIEDQLYPFGGACNRYYNLRYKINVDSEHLDLVKVRTELVFGKYAPPVNPAQKATTIGINRSFLVHRLFPFYYNFFTSLGFRIIVPDDLNEEALNRQTSSMCYPAQVTIGLFDNLIDKQPDYYFMPQIEEMYVPKGNTRKEFSSTCIFIQGEAFWIRQIFKDKDIKDKVLAPTVNFSGGWENGRDAFIGMAAAIGASRNAANQAYTKAIQVQEAFEEECREIGRKALAELHADPDKVATVILGRPYNALSEDANKGIPKKLTTRGYMVIPFDMLPFDEQPMPEPHEDYMHWEIGQQILRASKIVKDDKQLFGVYITNFLCAIDSLLVSYFRRMMGTKPSLTLELDGHTADAGINTRIDAFLDIIKNYLEVQKTLIVKQPAPFQPARIKITNKGAIFVDSQSREYPLNHPEVKMILPSMDDLGKDLMAAVFRKLGIRAVGMPVSDGEALRLGRSVTTCKECLPMILCIGSMLRYLNHRENPNEKLVVFQPRAAGYCRLGQYHVYMNMYIKEQQLPDVALISLANEERYAGLGPAYTLPAWESVVTGDVLDDIRNAILTIARDKTAAMEIFEQEFRKIEAALAGESKVKFYAQLKATAQRFREEIQVEIPLQEAPQVVIMGEIFVRRDIFSNQHISGRLAEKGFIARVSPIGEWIYYLNYMIKEKLHIPDHTLLGWLESFISDKTQRFVENKIKTILATSGLYEKEKIDIDDMVRYSKHIVPNTLKGEPGLIMGVMLRDALSRYSGVINIGPFGCMPVRFTEAVMQNNADMETKLDALALAGVYAEVPGFSSEDRIPFLTIEADGNPYPQLLEARFESFCLQASRVAGKLGQKVLVNI